MGKILKERLIRVSVPLIPLIIGVILVVFSPSLETGDARMLKPPEHQITRIAKDFALPGDPSFWETIPALTIDHYLWLNNGYTPRVEARLCWSGQNLYVFFKVFEPKIRVQFTKFQDPVYKDSCVEFFIDPFPEKKIGYINIETNAVGAMLIAIGPNRTSRTRIPESDLKGFEIVTSVKKPVNGAQGAEFWTLPINCRWPCLRNIMARKSLRDILLEPTSTSAVMRPIRPTMAPGVPSSGLRLISIGRNSSESSAFFKLAYWPFCFWGNRL